MGNVGRVITPNWREFLVLGVLTGGGAKKVTAYGAGPRTLDAMVANGWIVHVRDPGSRADKYEITPAGETAFRQAYQRRGEPRA